MSPDSAAAVERRPGRPRVEGLDQAIEAAALELLVEQGYAGMSLEQVALRAGVGKASIYRRWDSKMQLVLDAVIHRCEEHVVEPDTGSLRGDLLELYRAMLDKFRRDGEIMRAFSAEQSRHPELAMTFRDTFIRERRRTARAILERGVTRGELSPHDDLELLTDVGSSILWHRFVVTGAPIDDDLPERIIDQFFTP